jgi:hypothetical protein
MEVPLAQVIPLAALPRLREEFPKSAGAALEPGRARPAVLFRADDTTHESAVEAIGVVTEEHASSFHRPRLLAKSQGCLELCAVEV